MKYIFILLTFLIISCSPTLPDIPSEPIIGENKGGQDRHEVVIPPVGAILNCLDKDIRIEAACAQ